MNDIAVRRLCRILTNSRYNMPVDIIEGCVRPKITGEGYRYETRGGNLIYYPSAYSKVGWSNMVYCPSTISIEVGEEWLKENSWAIAYCLTIKCFESQTQEYLKEKLI